MDVILGVDEFETTCDIGHGFPYLPHPYLWGNGVRELRQLAFKVRRQTTVDVCVQVDIAELHVDMIVFAIQFPVLEDGHNVAADVLLTESRNRSQFPFNTLRRDFPKGTDDLPCKYLEVNDKAQSPTSPLSLAIYGSECIVKGDVPCVPLLNRPCQLREGARPGRALRSKRIPRLPKQMHRSVGVYWTPWTWMRRRRRGDGDGNVAVEGLRNPRKPKLT